ncbi:hypothetical protein HRbin19_00451 [bacterium HR19]|nr:hypothetical protein HRbin19_00451 [bacterium HR19]
MAGDMKIRIGRKILKKEDIYRQKEIFHREQAKLSFEEKIKILIQLQKIAKNIKRKGIVWKIR